MAIARAAPAVVGVRAGRAASVEALRGAAAAWRWLFTGIRGVVPGITILRTFLVGLLPVD